MAQAPASQPSGGNKGFFGNAMDMVFGNSKVGNPNPGPGPANPADVQNQSLTKPNNPIVPVDQNLNPNEAVKDTPIEDKSPLASLTDLWDPPKDKDGKPIVKQDDSVINFDETKFNEALKTLDFTKAVDPELMQKALGGDQASLVQIMNQVGKSSLGLTAKMTTSLVKQALEKQESKIRGEMTENFRSNSARNSLVQDNPALNHPALKPLVSSLETQFRSKYPEASGEDISKHAKTALVAMAEAIVGKPNSNNNQDSGNRRTVFGTDDVDWDAFASGEATSNISKM